MSDFTLKKQFSTSSPLPWQHSLWQRLFEFLEPPHALLPHALYFTGQSGVGKRHCARQFIQAFFCLKRQTQQLACGKCRSCKWMQAGMHPSLLWIKPETATEQIKIEQIRDSMDFIQETGLHDQARFVVIEPMDNLNHSAANALLKSLEEPPAHVYFILIHDQLGATIPATIVSRCQQIRFPSVSWQAASSWLTTQGLHATELQMAYITLSQGAPLRIIEQFDIYHTTRITILQGLIAVMHSQHHPVLISQKWMAEKLSLEIVLEWLLHFSADVLRRYFHPASQQIMNTDFASALADCAAKVNPVQVVQYLDYLLQIRRFLLQGVRLNVQLVFDVVLLQWQRVISQQTLLIIPMEV